MEQRERLKQEENARLRKLKEKALERRKIEEDGKLGPVSRCFNVI